MLSGTRGRLSREQRKASVMGAAVALEGELYWMCVSEEGYKVWGNEVKKAVAGLDKRVGKQGKEGAQEGLGVGGMHAVMGEGEVWRGLRGSVERIMKEGGKRKRGEE